MSSSFKVFNICYLALKLLAETLLVCQTPLRVTLRLVGWSWMCNYDRMPLLSSTTGVEAQVLTCSTTVVRRWGTTSQVSWLEKQPHPSLVKDDPQRQWEIAVTGCTVYCDEGGSSLPRLDLEDQHVAAG